MRLSKKWAKELESDELNGQKKISLKIETHKALRGIAKTNESYDDIIGRLITFYNKKYEYTESETVDNLTQGYQMIGSLHPNTNRIHTK